MREVGILTLPEAGSVGDGAASGVSVVIPTRDRAALVADAVDSALAQTVPPTEVIVVDDGSSDGTRELLERRFASSIRVLRHDRPRGRSAARNTGWRAAGSPLVAFLDSDDVWWPDKLGRQLPAFRDQNVDLVHARVAAIGPGGFPDPAGQVEVDLLYERARQRGDTYAALTEPWCALWTSSVVARRSAIERAGGFDEKLDHYEDWDLFWRIALGARIEFVDVPLVGYRVHDGNTDHAVAGTAAAAAWLWMHEKHLALVRGRPELPDRTRTLRNLTLGVALGHSWQGDHLGARLWAVRGLRYDPALAIRCPPVWRDLFGKAPRRRCSEPAPAAIPVRASTVPVDPGTMTVVVISHQRCESLRRLLDAIGGQLQSAPELAGGLDMVVVLDGSTDGSAAFLARYRLPIPLTVIEQPQRGRAAARNAGLQNATGALALMLDDDGVPRAGLIAAHRAAHDGTMQVVIGACHTRHAVIPVLTEHARRHGDALMSERSAVEAYQVTFANTSAPRSLLVGVGGFDEAFVGWGAEDGEFGARLLGAGVPIRYEPAAAVDHDSRLDRGGFLRTRYELGYNTARLLDRHPQLEDAYLVPRSGPLPGIVRRCWPRRPLTLRAIGAVALDAGRAVHRVAPSTGLRLMWLSWDALVAAGLLEAEPGGRRFRSYVSAGT